MDRVERSGREEVEGAGDTQIDPMMHERLVREVSMSIPTGRPPSATSSRHIHGSNSAVRRPVTGDRLEFDPQAMSRTVCSRIAERGPNAFISRLTNSVMIAARFGSAAIFEARRCPSSSSRSARASSSRSRGVRPSAVRRPRASGAVTEAPASPGRGGGEASAARPSRAQAVHRRALVSALHTPRRLTPPGLVRSEGPG